MLVFVLPFKKNGLKPILGLRFFSHISKTEGFDYPSACASATLSVIANSP